MNQTQFDKRLLLVEIEAQRALLRLELKSIERRLEPVSLLVAWSKRWALLPPSIATLTRTLGIDKDGRWGRLACYAALAALAVPLIKFVAGRDRSRRADT